MRKPCDSSTSRDCAFQVTECFGRVVCTHTRQRRGGGGVWRWERQRQRTLLLCHTLCFPECDRRNCENHASVHVALVGAPFSIPESEQIASQWQHLFHWLNHTEGLNYIFSSIWNHSLYLAVHIYEESYSFKNTWPNNKHVKIRLIEASCLLQSYLLFNLN